MTEIELITGRQVADRTAIITAAFQVCTQMRQIYTADLYQRSVAAFAEGALLPQDKGELLLEASMRFACPDQYDRTRSYATR
jgi:hypothetical protein